MPAAVTPRRARVDLPPVPYANPPEAQAMPDAPGAQVDPPGPPWIDSPMPAGMPARRRGGDQCREAGAGDAGRC
jgi:hypothetical protein